MTDRQREVYRYVVCYLAERGHSPTIREVSSAFGLSHAGAVSHLQALRRQGVLMFEEHKARTMRPVMPCGDDVGEYRLLVEGLAEYLTRSTGGVHKR